MLLLALQMAQGLHETGVFFEGGGEYLFIQPFWVLAAVYGIDDLCCGTQDLWLQQVGSSSRPGMEPRPPELEA